MKDSIFCHFLENNCGMFCKYIWHPIQMRFDCSYYSSSFFQSSPRMIFIFFEHSGIVLRVDHMSFLKMFPAEWLKQSIFLEYYDQVSKIKSGSYFIVSGLEPKMFEIIIENGTTKNLNSVCLRIQTT
jgi:hypothetical protein